MTDTRHAVIRNMGHDKLEMVRRYLPSNYTADSDGGSIFIHGEDRAGWTLDDYVIPRLASGLIRAEEITAPVHTYTAQTARDAQAAGYGTESYWQYLEDHAKRLAEMFPDRAEEFLTRSLSESLMGNDGN